MTSADWESLENALATAKRLLPMFVAEEFRRTYACRTPSTPRPLLDAYQLAGSVWSTINVIPEYRAVIDIPLKAPPVFITRGQYDFVSSANQELYRDCFETVECLELADCSHHGLLEHPSFYVSVLESFWKSTDRQTRDSIQI
jgi:pimeloyl-ACP methyl ester carboxylesterase